MNSNIRSNRPLPPVLLVMIATLVPSLAHAHIGVHSEAVVDHANPLFYGFAHPFGGLDHLCAMIAVGLLAAQRGARSLWLMPLSFVGAMALGGALGMAGVSLPFVEAGIMASVLVLGVLIAAGARLPLAASLILVGFSAIFHGQAHAAEMPPSASGIAYGAGFMLATSLLHAAGIFIAFSFSRMGQQRLVRYAGGAIAICGVTLCFV